MDTNIPASILSDLTRLDAITLQQVSKRRGSKIGQDISGTSNTTNAQITVIGQRRESNASKFIRQTETNRAEKQQIDDSLALAMALPALAEGIAKTGSRPASTKPKSQGSDVMFTQTEDALGEPLIIEGMQDMAPTMRAAVKKRDAMAMKAALEEFVSQLDTLPDLEPPLSASQLTMDFFIRLLDREQKIYENFFQELIQQVAHWSPERANNLEEIRKRYRKMYEKVPAFIQNIYQQSAANSKMLLRVYESLSHTKNTTSDMINIVDNLLQGDITVATKNHLLETKFAEALHEMEAVDAHKRSFNALMKTQRDEFEQQVLTAEKEKLKAIEQALQLSTKLGVQIGLSSVRTVVNEIHARRQYSADFVLSVTASNEEETLHISGLFTTWHRAWNSFLPLLRQRDQENIARLKRIHSDMTSAEKAFMCSLQGDTRLEENNRFLYDFKRINRDMIIRALFEWEDNLAAVLKNFSQEQTRALIVGMMKLQDLGQGLNSSLSMLINRAESWSTGAEYHKNKLELVNYNSDFNKSIAEMQKRIEGNEDIILRCKTDRAIIEDRYNYIMASDDIQVLSNADAMFVMDSIGKWRETIQQTLADIELRGAFVWNELPKKIEQLTSKVVDRIKADSEYMVEENNAVIYQMKELVINIINNITIDKADKEWQNQFLQVCEAQSACDIHFSQFSTGLNVINSQGQDLMPLVRRTSDAYIRAMNSLMNAARDRRAAIRDIDPVQSFLPPGKEEEQRKKKQFNLPYNLSNPAEETEALIALNNAIESILLDDPALPMQVIQQKQ